MQNPVLIWDGKEFSHVEMAHAEKLVREDKAQIVEHKPNFKLKYRNQFAGHTAPFQKKPIHEGDPDTPIVKRKRGRPRKPEFPE